MIDYRCHFVLHAFWLSRWRNECMSHPEAFAFNEFWKTWTSHDFGSQRTMSSITWKDLPSSRISISSVSNLYSRMQRPRNFPSNVQNDQRNARQLFFIGIHLVVENECRHVSLCVQNTDEHFETFVLDWPILQEDRSQSYQRATTYAWFA